MLLGGFFINLADYTDVRVIFFIPTYMSPFCYGFQGGIDSIGIQPKYVSRSPEDMWYNMLILVGIGVILRLVSVAFMQIVDPKTNKDAEIRHSR